MAFPALQFLFHRFGIQRSPVPVAVVRGHIFPPRRSFAIHDRAMALGATRCRDRHGLLNRARNHFHLLTVTRKQIFPLPIEWLRIVLLRLLSSSSSFSSSRVVFFPLSVPRTPTRPSHPLSSSFQERPTAEGRSIVPFDELAVLPQTTICNQ
jgi:hypothetical protein